MTKTNSDFSIGSAIIRNPLGLKETVSEATQRDRRCRICCRSIHSPYARYDEYGKITEGCVSPDHAGYYIMPSEYARWYNRPIAKKIRKGLKWSPVSQ